MKAVKEVKKRVAKKKQQKETRLPFEEREKVYSLSLFFTIVNRDQSSFYTKAYAEVGASMSFVFYSYSQPPIEIINVLGHDSLKKETVVTVVRTEDVEKLKKIAEERFSISHTAKGVAFACPIDGVSGIAVYKFLADQNREIRETSQNGK